MNKDLIQAIFAGLLLGFAHGVFAEEKLTKGYYSFDAMGCMMLRECTDNVRQIKSIKDIEGSYSDIDYSIISEEFNSILESLDKIGVMVFLAPEKYFPVGHRGVYHTVGNNFFLNDAYMRRPRVLMGVMRHEGWHAAQDCMGGKIGNNVIAIIKPEEEVPVFWKHIVEDNYPESVWPWEKEATWAGKTKNMTRDALRVCASETPMWEVYPPTPLTKKYLIKDGYVDK